jgi:hypothetical protein
MGDAVDLESIEHRAHVAHDPKVTSLEPIDPRDPAAGCRLVMWPANSANVHLHGDARRDLLALVAEVRRLRADRDALARIVRAVAASKPMRPRACAFCGAGVPVSGPWFADDHAPECEWRRAREWTEANPEGSESE